MEMARWKRLFVNYNNFDFMNSYLEKKLQNILCVFFFHPKTLRNFVEFISCSVSLKKSPANLFSIKLKLLIQRSAVKSRIINKKE